MLFNKKLTVALLAALILTSATDAQAMGWSWKKWALFGAVATVAALIIKKVWATPRRFDSEFHIAILNNNIARIRALVALGAHLERPIHFFNNTALMLAVHYNKIDVVRELVALGAHLETLNLTDQTALIIAAYYGRTDIARALIELGANLEAYNITGRTALMTAAYYGHREMVQTLIDLGANVHSQDRLENTALNHATQPNPYTTRLNQDDLINLITKEQNRTSTPLHQACSHGIGSENIELFLRNEGQRRAIEHLFADTNNLPSGTLTPRIEELLHGENANLDAENQNGHTARQYLQTRAWMMQPITITIRWLNGDKLTLNSKRGIQIHAVKRLIAQQISTPEHTVNTSMITLTRNNNNAEATDYEVAGITTEFHMVIGSTQRNNPERAQAGPANA